MSDSQDKPGPGGTLPPVKATQQQVEREARAARVAAALRANLQKRKQQARARNDESVGASLDKGKDDEVP